MTDRVMGFAVTAPRSIQAVNLSESISDAVACLCRDLSKDGITLSNEVDPTLHVTADPKPLQQVLFNLLINARQAIKHRHGRIRVTAEAPDNAFVVMRVSDNGCGIPAEHVPHIFDEFYSTKKERPDKSGVGLGLTLCREVIEEHGGRITVESEEGKGATFVISLPRAKGSNGVGAGV
jgi:signal transduction histidine kinase